MHTTIIDVNELSPHLSDVNWRVVDCRFDLRDPEAGRREYMRSHIPGAVYAHLNDDLSDMSRQDEGRHPLPDVATMCSVFGRLGIEPDTQIVAYDDADGGLAARLWWMLRYLGHSAVCVLDGGWQAWIEAEFATSATTESPAPAAFSGQARGDRLVTVDQVADAILLIDSRDPVRYRGESESLDPVAGHIPRAVNHFFRNNVRDDGKFLDPETLHSQFQALLGDVPARDAVFYCGSGVTACHNLLALAHAGFPEAKLYPGSWSEWCSDPRRPVATGVDP